MQALKGHEQVLDELLVVLGTLKVRKGAKMMDLALVKSAVGVARCLGSVEWEGMEEKDEEKIVDMVKELRFPTKYKGIGAESLIWAIEEMTEKIDTPLDPDIPIYFPSGDFSLFARKEFMVLCAFGSRAPKFWGASGQVYSIPSMASPDPWSEIDTTTQVARMPAIIVNTAPPSQCLSGWDNVVDRTALKFDVKERAKGSRTEMFPGEKRDILWEALRKFVVPYSERKGKVIGHAAAEIGVGDGKTKIRVVDAADVDWANADF
jgi:hypothetical protein